MNISVVLCTYNGERFLREQLDSIICQTYPIYELVIQDDCSTDRTFDIIKEYASKYTWIHLYKNDKNLGFKKNYGTSVSHTSGDYIAFCDQDDIWLPNHIKVLSENLGNKTLAVGNSLMVDEYGKSMGITLNEVMRSYYIPEDDIKKAYRLFYNLNIYQGANMLFKKSLLTHIMPIPEGVRYHDIWIASVACFCGGINYTDEIITLYRQHGGNITTNNKISIFRELKKHHHYDFSSDRIVIYNAIMGRIHNLSYESIEFLKEWKWYYDHSKLWYCHFRCWWHRFSHYRLVYESSNYKYFIVRSIQYLFTPPFNDK